MPERLIIQENENKIAILAKPLPNTANGCILIIKEADMPDTQEATNALKIGDKVPDFSLPAIKVGNVSSEKLKGKPYVLYFYPKDNTPHCTVQACAFRDILPSFSDVGVTVIGVSKNSLESHEKFSSQFNLTFPLAADETGEICRKFGVLNDDTIERATFLIDGDGIIRAIWHNVNVQNHADEVKKAIADL